MEVRTKTTLGFPVEEQKERRGALEFYCKSDAGFFIVHFPWRSSFVGPHLFPVKTTGQSGPEKNILDLEVVSQWIRKAL